MVYKKELLILENQLKSKAIVTKLSETFLIIYQAGSKNQINLI
jgi:hypothetical protein